MATWSELRSELAKYDAGWLELKPFLPRELYQEEVRITRQLAVMERSIARAEAAESKGKKSLAFFWLARCAFAQRSIQEALKNIEAAAPR